MTEYEPTKEQIDALPDEATRFNKYYRQALITAASVCKELADDYEITRWNGDPQGLKDVTALRTAHEIIATIYSAVPDDGDDPPLELSGNY